MSEAANVSRETSLLLDRYVSLLLRWTPKINLIGKSTQDEVWDRHIEDSLQLVPEEPVRHWVDLGSGGGLPGIVLAICLKDQGTKVTLVESDLRKATFLRTVSHELDLNVTVWSERIEEVEPLDADVVSARALAPLPKLLGFVERHMAHDGRALLLKGENWRQELQLAQEIWSFSYQAKPSRASRGGVILEVGDLVRVEG